MMFGDGRRKSVDRPSDEEIRRLLLRQTSTGSPDWLWQTDEQRRIVEPGPELVEATGMTVEALEGTPILQVLAGPTWDSGSFSPGLRRLAEKLKEREPFADLRLPVFLRGEERWWEVGGTPRFNTLGEVTGYFGVVSDVTEQRAAADRINRMARFDALTGLPNRLATAEAIDRAISESRGAQRRCSAAMLAITNLNELKLAEGYRAVEALLTRVAEAATSAVGVDAFIGHIAPGEFVAVFPASISRQNKAALLSGVVDRTDAAIGASPAALGWCEVTYPGDGNDGDALIAAGLERVYATAGALRRGTRQRRDPAKENEDTTVTSKEALAQSRRASVVTYGRQAEEGLRLLIDEQRSRLHNGPPEALNEIELEQMVELRRELQNLILLAEEGAEVSRKAGIVATLVKRVFRFSADTGELFVAGLKPFLASAPLALGTLVLLQSVCTPAVGAVAAPGAALAVLAGHYGLDLRRKEAERKRG